MNTPVISVGMKFSQWTVLAQAEKKSRHPRWLCRCQCGRELIIYQCHLRSGNSKSCRKCHSDTKGMSKTPTWMSWSAMLERCTNKNHDAFHRYGGRGITVCDKWGRFAGFYEDMGLRPNGMSIDRIDNNIGYCKENCRWATHKEQSNNMSTNRKVEYRGKEYTIKQLSEYLGMNYDTLWKRFNCGSQLDRPVTDCRYGAAK